MTRQEKRKWAIATVLAVVLVGVLWVQYSPHAAAPQPTANRRVAPKLPAGAATAARPDHSNQPALIGPANPQEVTSLNPFDLSRVAASAVEQAPESPDRSRSAPGERAEVAVPDWLKSGRIQARLRVGGDDAIVVNGRVLRVGEVVDGVEIVRIEDDTIWIRRAGQSDGP